MHTFCFHRSSENKLQSCDFDAVLRLKCIANYWEVPVIIFGRIFEVEQLQYAAVSFFDISPNQDPVQKFVSL